MDVEIETQQAPHIMELIASAPWREAVTYRETWPHQYVVVKRDGQQELLAAFCERITRGEGVECQFFHQRRQYLFLGDYKYWIMVECSDIDRKSGAFAGRIALGKGLNMGKIDTLLAHLLGSPRAHVRGITALTRPDVSTLLYIL